MLRIGDIEIKTPVLLAPMAGITDRPFRDIVSGFGAGLVVSEMVASRELVNAHPTTEAKAEIAADADATSVQIVGREACWMAEAARALAGQGARIIDINMGCPARKVTSGASGSALMRTPDHALSLIEAVVDAVDVPVTLKTRLGWDDDMLNAPEIAARAEAAGIQMITIHGRTRCQMYRGRADWTAIRRVVDAVDIPVIANGDIVDGATARQALDQSGAAGVMIGRAARGKPWLMARIAAELDGKTPQPAPTGAQLADLMIAHYEAQLAFYGRDIGVRNARKHIEAYLAPLTEGAEIRARIIRETDPAAVIRTLRSAVADSDVTRLAA